ncbi:MAG: hypothetical protein HC875_27305 [Anaerolineales bacterium]|nr:hypothetical protein [Anaerolineales bacterium]
METELEPDHQLKKDISTAFKAWYKTDDGSSPFSDWQLFRRQKANTARQATNMILLGRLRR